MAYRDIDWRTLFGVGKFIFRVRIGRLIPSACFLGTVLQPAPDRALQGCSWGAAQSCPQKLWNAAAALSRCFDAGMISDAGVFPSTSHVTVPSLIYAPGVCENVGGSITVMMRGAGVPSLLFVTGGT